MDIQTISQWTGLFVALAPVLLLFAFAWIVFRTDSLHVVLRRTWLLVYGSQDISDPAIRAFVDDQSSLVAFRMFSGIRASSVEDAQQLMTWAKENEVSLRKIASCGSYFDVKLRQVKERDLPSRLVQRATVLLTVLCFAVVVICIVTAASPKGGYYFKNDLQWLLADQSSAQSIWPPQSWFAAPLLKTDCNKPLRDIAERTSFSTERVTVLCGMLADRNWVTQLTTDLRAQRIALLLMAAELFCFALWLAFFLRRVFAARELALRRIDPSLPDSQLSFSF